MNIALVIKYKSVEVYTYVDAVYTPVGIEQLSYIEGESAGDYEKRMVFVVKNLCTEMRESAFYISIIKNIKNIQIILCSPWCVYDVVNIEKDFQKPIKISKNTVADLILKKDTEDLYTIESHTSHIQLNGYTVQTMEGQIAQLVELQYIHIYGKKIYIEMLKKTVETIFNIHTIQISSIYSLANSGLNTESNLISILIEENSIDIAYIQNKTYMGNMFVQESYIQMIEVIAEKLSISIDMVEQILVSKANQKNADIAVKTIIKHSKNIWPDLDTETQKVIQDTMQESLEKITKKLRDFIDELAVTYTRSTLSLDISCTGAGALYAYGQELAKQILDDTYIQMKVHMNKDIVSVKQIFNK